MDRDDCLEEDGVWNKTKEVCTIGGNGPDVIESNNSEYSVSSSSDSSNIAPLLSFIWPGAGQIYKGHITRGLVITLFLFLSAILTIFYIGFIIAPVLYVWQIYDAKQL